jgi:hypothetical protein
MGGDLVGMRAYDSRRSAGFSKVLIVGAVVVFQQRSGMAWTRSSAVVMASAQGQLAGSRK